MRPVYFYHVRKCAGQSVTEMVMRAFYGPGYETAKAELVRAHRASFGGLAVTGWEPEPARLGWFDYAFSHETYGVVQLPPGAFTFTVLRDPAARVVSHYRMLKDFQERGERDDVMGVEGGWLGDGSFGDFVENTPRPHLLRQLYMFSERGDPREACRNVLGLGYYFFVEEFGQGMDGLGWRLGLEFDEEAHVMRSRYEFEPGEDDLAALRKKLELEQAMYDALWGLRA
jgi:hypothetical protein